MSMLLCDTDHHSSWSWQQPPPSQVTRAEAPTLAFVWTWTAQEWGCGQKLDYRVSWEKKREILCKKIKAPKEGAEQGITERLPTGNPDTGAEIQGYGREVNEIESNYFNWKESTTIIWSNCLINLGLTKLKHVVVKGFVQIPLEHWQGWGHWPPL